MALVKIKKNRSASDFLVCKVTSRKVADLLVCKVTSREIAKGRDELWCYIDSDSEAHSKICLVNSRSAADLLVCYVTSREAAGWNNKKHKLIGKIFK